MECPRCGEPLSTTLEGLFEDIETHACESCGGAFYPPGNLDRLDDSVAVNVEELTLRPRPGERALRCPVGHAVGDGGYRSAVGVTLKPRDTAADPSVALWECDSCGGFWLEGDTLERLRLLALAESERDNRDLNERTEKRRRDEQKRKKSSRPPPG
jgi:Zn-finger nucleic acid-binding protein